MPGPVFFRQVRTGRNEQPFSMLKFRTMYNDAEERRHEIDHLNEVDGPLFKVQNDPRVTRIGHFLRRTSLDEFPQLINVWMGDMSLVGPRPFVVSEAMKIEGWARKRFEARPGMTGLWQVRVATSSPISSCAASITSTWPHGPSGGTCRSSGRHRPPSSGVGEPPDHRDRSGRPGPSGRQPVDCSSSTTARMRSLNRSGA